MIKSPPHIVGHQIDSGGHSVSIKYAYKTEGQWNYEVAVVINESLTTPCTEFALELNKSGVPHIVYTDHDDRDLWTSDRAKPSM